MDAIPISSDEQELPSSELLHQYELFKTDLLNAIKEHSNMYFCEKSDSGFVGLLNQGATCYLNSLIQALFMTPEFRREVLTWDSSTSQTKLSSSIPFQLQTLFSKLSLSSLCAVSTKSLTKSFGWTNMEAFRQHDVQELCRILFDALSQSSPTFFDLLQSLYEGEFEDTISCPSCGYERVNKTTFMDLQVPVENIPSIEQAMAEFVRSETLDADNKWECSSCSKRVQATKALRLVKIPKILTLHLKRFVFDLATYKRRKICDPFLFHEQLDMNPFVFSSDQKNETDYIYDLFAILIHSGNAHGGHYHAYIRNPSSDKWFDFNDANVTELDEEDVHALLHSELSLESLNDEEEEEVLVPKQTIEDENNKEDEGKDSDIPKDPDQIKIKPSRSHGACNAYYLVYRQSNLKMSTNHEEEDIPQPPENINENGKEPEETTQTQDEDGNNEYSLIPSNIREEIDDQNLMHTQLMKMMEIHKNMTELRFYAPQSRHAGSLSFVMNFHKTLPLSHVFESSFPKLIEMIEKRIDVQKNESFLSSNGTEEEVNKNDQEEEESNTIDRSSASYETFDPENEFIGLFTETDTLEQNQELLHSIQNLPKNTHIRLRRWNPHAGRLGETFGGREEENMVELGLFRSASLVFETRSVDSEEFEEFNPNEMRLRISPWDKESQVVDTSKTEDVIVEGEKHATVGSLREAVCRIFSIENPSLVAIMRLDRSSPVLFHEQDDERELKKHFHVYPGDELVVEILDPTELVEINHNDDVEKGEEESIPSPFSAWPFFQSLFSSITICFNNPNDDVRSSSSCSSLTQSPSTLDNKSFDFQSQQDNNNNQLNSNFSTSLVEEDLGGLSSNSESPNLYPYKVQTTLDTTLRDVKHEIAKEIGLLVDDFHFTRSKGGSQFKDEFKTLRGLSVSHMSGLYVMMGPPCAPDEFLIEFQVTILEDSLSSPPPSPRTGSTTSTVATLGSHTSSTFRGQSPTFSSFSDHTTFSAIVPINGDWKIKRVKEALADKLFETLPDITWSRIRLKDKSKGGVILRDSRILNRSVLNLSDGRKLQAEVLDFDEIIQASDLVIAVRKCVFSVRKIRPPVDFVVSGSASVSELFDQIYARFYAHELENEDQDKQQEEQKVVDSKEDIVKVNDGETNDGDKKETKSEEEENENDSEEKGGLVVVGMESIIPLSSKISIAKAPTFGPPLTLKGAVMQSWNENEWLTCETVKDGPLSLRDGSLILVRSEADFEERAKLRKAKRAEDKSSNQTSSSSTKRRKKGRFSHIPKQKKVTKEAEIYISVGGDEDDLKEVGKLKIEEGGRGGGWKDEY